MQIRTPLFFLALSLIVVPEMYAQNPTQVLDDKPKGFSNVIVSIAYKTNTSTIESEYAVGVTPTVKLRWAVRTSRSGLEKIRCSVLINGETKTSLFANQSTGVLSKVGLQDSKVIKSNIQIYGWNQEYLILRLDLPGDEYLYYLFKI